MSLVGLRLSLVAVGRARDGPEARLYEVYRRRLSWRLDLTEVATRRASPDPAAQRAEEGRLILAALPVQAVAVALDPGGKDFSSERLAAWLGERAAAGEAGIAFAIGGAEGLDPGVLERADLKLSLGPMIWPHLLVRVMLAEQLYRAQTIISGHPYHRG